LWWPPNKLCGRYLAPYLSRQVGEAADVMPEGAYALSAEIALVPTTPARRRTYHVLCDRADQARPLQGANHEQR
jgi:hypothetical protein